MSQENVETVRAGFDAFAQGDLEGILRNFAPEIVLSRVEPLPDPVEHHGRAGFMKFLADWTAGFSEFEMTAEQYVEVGDRVVVQVQQRATGASSGAPVEAHFWFVHTLSEGRVTRITIFATESQAVAAAGGEG